MHPALHLPSGACVAAWGRARLPDDAAGKGAPLTEAAAARRGRHVRAGGRQRRGRGRRHQLRLPGRGLGEHRRAVLLGVHGQLLRFPARGHKCAPRFVKLELTDAAHLKRAVDVPGPQSGARAPCLHAAWVCRSTG